MACRPEKTRKIVSGLILMILSLALAFPAGGTNRDDQQVRDRQITISIQSRLADDNALGTLLEVSVHTEKGTVYLSGIATTEHAKERTEKITREVSGVKNIVNNIEVRP